MTRRPGPLGRTLAAVAAAWCVAIAPGTAAGRPVTLASEDGTALAATLYEAESRPAPGVVLVHMLQGSRADWDLVAGQMAAAGLSALAVDLRGHGGSSGGGGELRDMVQDVRAAARWLASRPGIRPDRLGVAGASLGANLALLAAADLPEVQVVAVVSPSLDYRGVRVGPEQMRRVGDRPVWLAASTEDPYALRTLKELAPTGPGPREQYLSPAAAHGTRLFAVDGNLAGALVDWLRQRLLF